ncbi:MAG: Mth938-like domain-containing protein [Arenimonas sp.]
MQLTLENPDFRYSLRGVNAEGVLVNERRLAASFILSPMVLIDAWRPRSIAELVPEDMEPVLALNPSVVLLGSGATLRFPSAAVMAACLTRGIGIEVMDNAAAARTFNVLATEARKVVAAFLLPPL